MLKLETSNRRIFNEMRLRLRRKCQFPGWTKTSSAPDGIETHNLTHGRCPNRPEKAVLESVNSTEINRVIRWVPLHSTWHLKSSTDVMGRPHNEGSSATSVTISTHAQPTAWPFDVVNVVLSVVKWCQLLKNMIETYLFWNAVCLHSKQNAYNNQVSTILCRYLRNGHLFIPLSWLKFPWDLRGSNRQ